MNSKWPAYCSHCDTHHFPASTCPPPLDPTVPKAETPSERPAAEFGLVEAQ